MGNLKDYFLLDSAVIFLNHGSFGATPKPVFDAYQSWQLRLERQPVLFLGRELDTLLRESRNALGEYLNADVEDLVYIPNAAHGVNIIAHSLQLVPDHEVLTSDHEYGAGDYTWDFICGKTGAKYIRQSISLPVQEEAAQGLVVLVNVVTFARMAAGDHHAIRTARQGLEDEGRIEPSRAHQADQADVGRVLHGGRAGQVGCAIRTPVAGEADNGIVVLRAAGQHPL